MTHGSVTRALFRGVRARQKAGYPRFKPYQRFDQVLFVAGDGARWKPAEGARWAHATFQAAGDADEQFVAGQVAEAVVDDLEAVEIEEEDCEEAA